jgi:glycosyltransferase involved in cell wall biosynthesis
MTATVTIAALNEARNIGAVVRGVRELGYRCIVVDDGSSDGTAEAAETEGAEVVRHVINLGQGQAMLTGFLAALDDPDCQAVIGMDGDGQHDPAEIPAFLAALAEGKADVIVGSRLLADDVVHASVLHRLLRPYYNGLINRMTAYKISDPLTGYRCFSRGALERVPEMFEVNVEPQYFTVELFYHLSRAKVTLGEIPVRVRPRASGKSHKGLFNFGFGILMATFRLLLSGTGR